jgi:hypothetical protein
MAPTKPADIMLQDYSRAKGSFGPVLMKLPVRFVITAFCTPFEATDNNPEEDRNAGPVRIWPDGASVEVFLFDRVFFRSEIMITLFVGCWIDSSADAIAHRTTQRGVDISLRDTKN